MQSQYICSDCGKEMSAGDYEQLSDTLCPECGAILEENQGTMIDSSGYEAINTTTAPPSGNPMKLYPPGMGKGSPVPPEIRGWNWGAFFMNILWGFAHGLYWQALLTLVPVVGTIMVFVLGAKGNVWAWQNREWKSIEHFKHIQKKWAIVGLLLFVVSIGFVVFMTLLTY